MHIGLALTLVVVASVSSAADTPPQPIPFSVRSWFYEEAKDLLLPGDSVYAIATRQARGNEGPTWSDERLTQALSDLAAVDMEGIERVLVLSTYQDLERVVADLPDCVDVIAWNSERGMTPSDELQRLPELVPRFADLCHQHGYRMTWAPTNIMFSRNPDLFQLAAFVDGLGLQHQRVLQSGGIEAFLRLSPANATRSSSRSILNVR